MARIIILIVGMMMIGHVLLAQSKSTRKGKKISTVTYIAPSWAPSDIRKQNVRYYYLPDHEAYYDLRAKFFILYRVKDNRWLYSQKPPKSRSGYLDLTKASIVPIDYDKDNFYTLFDMHKVKYPKGYKYAEVDQNDSRHKKR